MIPRPKVVLSMPRGIRSMSMRRRLVLFSGGILATGIVAFGILVGSFAGQASQTVQDQLLAASALMISGLVQSEGDTINVELPFTTFAMFTGEDKVFYSIINSQDVLVTGYDDLPRVPVQISADPVFTTVQYRGWSVRMVTVGRLVSTGPTPGWVTIKVAQTREQQSQLASRIALNAMAPALALGLLGVGLIWFGVGFVLRPLKRLEREVAGRSVRDLSPLRSSVPPEVQRLVSTLNHFMGRLDKSIDRLRGLVAEAAHEIRTPLAALQAQSDLAYDSADNQDTRARLAMMKRASRQLGQTVSQLLAEASVTHRIDSSMVEVVTFGEIVEDVFEALPDDRMSRLIVKMSPRASEARLVGDPLSYREMLRNLLDNAFSYSRGDVRLVADARSTALMLMIADRGPGIPPDQRKSVLERFSRGAWTRDVAGSGLGLAIVAQVLEAYGGTIQFGKRRGGGLIVKIVLRHQLED